MIEAILTSVLQQLGTVFNDKVKEEWSRFTNLKDEVRTLELSLRAIRAALEDAEDRQIVDKPIKLWLDGLKHACYDMEDVLDEWSIEFPPKNRNGEESSKFSYLGSKVRSVFTISKKREIAFKIKKICEGLTTLSDIKKKYILENREVKGLMLRKETTCYTQFSELFGRDEIKRDIVDSLLSKINGKEGKHIQTISIVGMGGVGKTALARAIFNDKKIEKTFENRTWIWVSNKFDQKRIALAMLATYNPLPMSSDVADVQHSVILQSLFDCLRNKIQETKFFLVLDDVWAYSNEEWEQLQAVLQHGKPGSSILVTTPKESVGRRMSLNSALIYHLPNLPEVDCYSIFKQFAFASDDQLSELERENLELIGSNISKKCKGLPLVARSLGEHLQDKRARVVWESVMNKELYKLKSVWECVLSSLLLSYYDLPSTMRRCFLYCAIFPKGFRIWRDHLIRHWMAQDYLTSDNAEMEEIGREYFEYLVSSCLFQDCQQNSDASIVVCEMHDIMHDLVQFLAENEFVIKEASGNENLMLQLQSKEARHLTVVLGESHLPTSIENASKLRSLVTFSDTENRVVTYDALHNLFQQSLLLKVLDLGCDGSWDILTDKIPSKISNLKQLKHLNLYCSKMIRTLPNSVGKLRSLMSLDVEGCSGLEKLPDSIGNLTELRVLSTRHCSGLTYYPKGISRLTSLTTLSDIIAIVDHDHPTMFSLGDLANLNNLCGSLRLKLLGNVINDDEARRAKLQSKIHLRQMEINLPEGIDQAEAITILRSPSLMNVLFINDTEW